MVRSVALPFRRSVAMALALLLAALLAPLAATANARGVMWERNVPGIVDPALRDAHGVVHVIVSGVGTGLADLKAAVVAHHGVVRAPLPIADAVSAAVPASDVDAVASSPGVRAVTLDKVGRFNTYSYDSTATASNFVASTGAGAAWQQGYTGQGIGVAVIDTGISPMPDLAGRVVWGPDLSGEGKLVDSYGHGTVMASIIGGNGADSATNSSGAFTGVAPKATLVAVKTAGRNGAVDVSTILQAMSWIAAYKDQYNIRVASLSWGTTSTQDPAVDPLDYAVERLWRLGVVVVVSAGNDGPNANTITKPGDDPLVLTAGAYDDKQNSDPNDDSVAPWSSRGPTAQGAAKPDLVSPGRYIIAQRSYGSEIETDYPKALYAPSYIRGSGTSQATAMTAGLAALLVQAHPTWTPDQVKAALKMTAVPINGVASTAQGTGRVNLKAALTVDPGPATQQTPVSNGLGSIDASRGGNYVQAICNGTATVIQGEIDAHCAPWDGAAWTGAAWTGAAWTGAAWTGAAWTGAAWTGAAWTGGTWTGAAWTGAAWTGAAWTGAAWTGEAWTSALYDDFMTAFWGNQPPWWKHLPGEVSAPAPPIPTLPDPAALIAFR